MTHPFLKVDHEKIAELKSLAEAGKTMTELASRFGVSPSFILYWMIKLGIPRQGTRGPKPTGLGGSSYKPKKEPYDLKRAIEKKYPGMLAMLGVYEISMEEIGQKFQITRERVRQFERMLGLPKRLARRREEAVLKKEITAIQAQSRKDARRKRFVDAAVKMDLLIRSGAPRTDLLAVSPWPNFRNGYSDRFQVSQLRYRLQVKSGMKISKMHHYHPQNQK